MVDTLGRRPFAEVIGTRIEEVWKEQQAERTPKAAFMIHLHGPWGSGKTSVLNFLKTYLQDDERLANQERDPKVPKWVVVNFNAWQQQRIRPPWWTLISAIYADAAGQLNAAHRLELAWRWGWWKFVADRISPLIGFLAVGLAIALAVSVKPNDPGKQIELGLKLIPAAFLAWGGIHTLARSLLFGSAQAAQIYTRMRTDPLGPIVELFGKLVAAIDRPLVVFIDDLDRCEAKYIVDLLEGIQTLFRAARVTYVVAGDRKWICSGFETQYENFTKEIGEPGRPLGYLFLDKVFQVSTSIPTLSDSAKETYWAALLAAAKSQDPKAVEETQKKLQVTAEQEVKGIVTKAGLEAKIEGAKADPEREQAMRAAAAIQITRAEAQVHTEHELRKFSHLLESNPRSMKRLVNTYGFHQATHFLERREVPAEALARWTIVELRWPILAEFLATRSELTKEFATRIVKDPTKESPIPRRLRELAGDPELTAVLGTVLNDDAIRKCVGLRSAEAGKSASA